MGFFGRGYLKDFPNRNWWKTPVDRVLEPGQGAATDVAAAHRRSSVPSQRRRNFRPWRRRHGRSWDSRYRHPCVGSHRSCSFSLASSPSLLRQIADIVARLCLLVFMCYVHVWEVPSATVEDWEKMNPEVRCNIYIYIFFRHCPRPEHRGTFQIDRKSQYVPCTIEWCRVPHMVQQ